MRSTKLLSLTRSLLGIEPTTVPPGVFAIDERRLRFGRFARTEQRVDLQQYFSVELPAEIFHEGPLGGPLHEPGALDGPLRQLLERIAGVVEEASLVLPDEWLRVSFAESEDLPSSASQRAEVMRFKLRRLVPFRVEDLRVRGTEVAALETQSAPRRLLLGFGIELLLRQLEDAFRARGVRIGHISNQSLSIVPALKKALAGAMLGAVVYVTHNGYSLVFTRHGEPTLHRFKPLEGAPASLDDGRHVRRDLMLTREFLNDQIRTPGPSLIVLVGPREAEAAWREWLEEVFEVPVKLLADEWPFLEKQVAGVPVHEIVPMLGAACREVR